MKNKLGAAIIFVSFLLFAGCNDVRHAPILAPVTLKPKIVLERAETVGFTLEPTAYNTQIFQDAFSITGFKNSTFGAGDVKVIIRVGEEFVLNRQYIEHRPDKGQQGFLGRYSLKRSATIVVQVTGQNSIEKSFLFEGDYIQGSYDGPLYNSPMGADQAFNSPALLEIRIREQVGVLSRRINDFLIDMFGRGQTSVSLTVARIDSDKAPGFPQAVIATEQMIERMTQGAKLDLNDREGIVKTWEKLIPSLKEPSHVAAANYNLGLVIFLIGEKEKGALLVMRAVQVDEDNAKQYQATLNTIKRLMEK